MLISFGLDFNLAFAAKKVTRITRKFQMIEISVSFLHYEYPRDTYHRYES